MLYLWSRSCNGGIWAGMFDQNSRFDFMRMFQGQKRYKIDIQSKQEIVILYLWRGQGGGEVRDRVRTMVRSVDKLRYIMLYTLTRYLRDITWQMREISDDGHTHGLDHIALHVRDIVRRELHFSSKCSRVVENLRSCDVGRIVVRVTCCRVTCRLEKRGGVETGTGLHATLWCVSCYLWWGKLQIYSSALCTVKRFPCQLFKQK